MRVITNLEALPDFDFMPDDEVVTWWECNEVSAEILTLIEASGEEIDFDY